MTRTEMLSRIGGDPGLNYVLGVARDALDDDPGHDLDHALRVALWTTRLLGTRGDAREGIAAALLHDLVNVAKDSPKRAQASSLSAVAARPHLVEAGFGADSIDRICGAIRDHSFSRGVTPTSPVGCALQDADRLEALGAIGIFRTVSTGVRMGSTYFHARDPWAETRERDDKSYSVDHFFVKLLRLPDSMCTAQGRAEAMRRAKIMVQLLDALGSELGVPLGDNPLVDAVRAATEMEAASQGGDDSDHVVVSDD